MLGSRSFYAILNGIVYEFQDKRFRDWFIAHNKDANLISAIDAYTGNYYTDGKWVKVSHQNYKRSSAWEDRYYRNFYGAKY